MNRRLHRRIERIVALALARASKNFTKMKRRGDETGEERVVSPILPRIECVFPLVFLFVRGTHTQLFLSPPPREKKKSRCFAKLKRAGNSCVDGGIGKKRNAILTVRVTTICQEGEVADAIHSHRVFFYPTVLLCSFCKKCGTVVFSL